MGGLALQAKSDGHRVSGSDENVYPPMSTQLEEQGIVLSEGYDPSHIPPDTDLVIIGNALSRGNPSVEHVLSSGLTYTSGPRWLGEKYLRQRTVIAGAGTHGKTTTASMVAHILEQTDPRPGLLIGGVREDFCISASDGDSLH